VTKTKFCSSRLGDSFAPHLKTWNTKFSVLSLEQISSPFSSNTSQDSSVGIATGYGPDDRMIGFRFPTEAGNFSPHHSVHTGSVWPTQPPVQWVTGALSLGLKRSEREADHSPPSSVDVEEYVELYLHSPNAPSWRGTQLKHRDNFTF
jgi:hypothetical protein